MNTKHILGLLGAGIISAATLVACNKDDNNVPVPEKVQKLIKSSWKIKSITTPSIVTPAEDSNLVKACNSDDIIIFSSTGYDFQDGAVKCDSTVFPYNKNNWTLDIAKDSLYLAAGTSKVIGWKVTELTDTSLNIKWLDSIAPTNKRVKTIKFKH